MTPRHRYEYRRAALHHPVHVVALTIAALIAITILAAGAELYVPLLLFAVLEAVVLGVIPQIGRFRRSVEEQTAEDERAEAAAARAIVAANLGPEHRSELEALERTAEAVRAHAGVVRLADDWTGASELVDLYGRIALAHRASVEAFGAVVGCTLDEQTARVELGLACATESTRHALMRRLHILRSRRESWLAARRQQETMAIELATIADQVRWMREQCSLTSFAPLREELDMALSTSQEGARVVRELGFEGGARPPPVAVRVAPCEPATTRDSAEDELVGVVATALPLT